MPMTSRRLRLSLALCGLMLATPGSHAGDVQGDAYDCNELWRMRNEIYKAAGYCFKNPKAVAQLGNAGCKFVSETDAPLSHVDRSTLAEIRKSERRQRCL